MGMDLDVKGTTSQQKLISNMLAQSLAMAAGSISSNPNKWYACTHAFCMLYGSIGSITNESLLTDIHIHTYIHTYKHTHACRQTDRQLDRPTDRPTDRH